MRVITEGYDYEVVNKVNPNLTQGLHFYRKTGADERDGTTLEEVIKAVIHRLAYLNDKLPDYHNEMALTLFRSGLTHLKERTAERIAQGIEGTMQPSLSNDKKTNYP